MKSAFHHHRLRQILLPASGTWLRGFLVVAGMALFFPGAVGVKAYDPPDFRVDLFSGDGVFLAEDQRASLLEALAAIASNFPDNPRVDDDLREKALALALRLDPLHHHSRAAHRELSVGSPPKPTSFFDSLPAVSETLWSVAMQLVQPPLDPEEVRLAPFLFELSLLTHPDPPEDRLEIFARACDRRPPSWDRATVLQSAANRSTGRALSLFEEGVDRLRKRKELADSGGGMTDGGTGGEPMTPATPVGSTEPPIPARIPGQRPPRPEPMEPVSLAIATVREVRSVESRPTPGVLSLTLRSPRSGFEREWYEEKMAASVPFPLLSPLDEIPIEGLEVPGTLAASRGWTWPDGAIGVVTFEPSAPPPGPRRLLRMSAGLPCLVLLEGVLKKTPLNADFVLLGDIDPATLKPSLPSEALIPSLEAGASMGRKYLLVPAAVLDELVLYLQKSGRLELLFGSELVSYADADAAVDRFVRGVDPALAGASTIFGEIKTAGERMPLAELAANPSAQARLESILAACPDHLSAKAMLEFARRPVSAEIRLAQAADKIHAVVAPFLILDDPEEDISALPAFIEDGKKELGRLRTLLPAEVRDLHIIGEDLLEASEAYLTITNKGTSIANQKLREATEEIDRYHAEWARLGLPKLEESEE